MFIYILALIKSIMEFEEVYRLIKEQSVITESGSGGVHISVDVQSEYMDHVNFDVAEYYKWMYDTFSQVIVYVNGVELGFPSKEEHISWLVYDMGVDEEIVDSFDFREKGYAFFRSCMDEGYHECLTELIEYMFKNGINDSRDLDEDDFDKIKNEFEYCDEIIEFIQDSGDGIFIPDLMHELSADSLNKVTLSGGGDTECLEEVRLALTALGIQYTDMREYIY